MTDDLNELRDRLRTCRDVLTTAWRNGAWGVNSTDEEDSADEILTLLGDLDEALDEALGEEPEEL
jgi:hypothetical protein